MAQFQCEICGAGFEEHSRWQHHMLASHPPQAPSAADIERAIKGVNFPLNRQQLVEALKVEDEDIREIFKQLPDHDYRDAAEVARAFGKLRSRQQKPDYQPSQVGGARARETLSAASVAYVFKGMNFPATGEELKAHAQQHGNGPELEVINRFRDKTYHSMADVAREMGRIMPATRTENL